MQLSERKALKVPQYLLRVREIRPSEGVARVLAAGSERGIIFPLRLGASDAEYALRPAVEAAYAVDHVGVYGDEGRIELAALFEPREAVLYGPQPLFPLEQVIKRAHAEHVVKRPLGQSGGVKGVALPGLYLHARSGGFLPRESDVAVREVHERDVCAVLCEVDGVAPGAAAEVEHALAGADVPIEVNAVYLKLPGAALQARPFRFRGAVVIVLDYVPVVHFFRLNLAGSSFCCGARRFSSFS